MDRFHYTGLLSLKPLKRSEILSWGSDLWIVDEKSYKPCYVVDGQQRLTTIIVLLNELVIFVRSLPDNIEKKDESIYLGAETIKEICSRYISQTCPPQNIITTYIFGYEVENPSEEYLRYKIFNEPDPGEITENYYTKNLKNAKEFFADNISALYNEEGIDGLNNLYKKITQRLMFNLLEIEDDYDVFVAFETMNNRGKRLTNLELLKNRLIYLTTIYGSELDEKSRIALRKKINDAWKKVYIQLGKNNNAALSDDEFLKAHWIIYFAYSRKKGDDYITFLLNKFSPNNVFEKKTVVKELEKNVILEDSIEDNDEDDEALVVEEEATNVVLRLQPSEIANYVDSLKDLSKYWYDTYFPNESTTLTEKEKLWLDRLYRIGMGFFRPLITVALCKCRDTNLRIELFTEIERFIFVCFRLARYNQSYKSNVYYVAARDLYYDNTTIQKITEKLRETVDENIKYAIPGFITYIRKNLDSGKKEGYYAWNTLRYFLYEYEFKLWESTGVKKLSWELFTQTEKDMVTIEHILPQTPSKWYWKNQFRQFINNENEMNALTGSLGNLLPLAQSINSALQNDSFDEKKNPTNPEKRGYSRGSNSEIEVAKEADWDGKRIYERATRLLTFMETRWGITMTQEQKNDLSLVNFVNDQREIPEELPFEEDPDPSQTASDRRRNERQNYWTYAIPIIRGKLAGSSSLFGNVSPSGRDCIDGYFGLKRIHLYCQIRKKKPVRCLVGVYIDSEDKARNKQIFDLLYSHKADIEARISMSVDWNRNDDKRYSSIDVTLKNANYTDQTQWETISEFHSNLAKELMDYVIDPYLNDLRELD